MDSGFRLMRRSYPSQEDCIRFGDDFLLVHVRVDDPSIRYRRMRERGEARDPKSWEEFQAQGREEEELFSMGQTIELADTGIRNDTELAEFHRRIEERLSEFVNQGRK
jgi:dephospho-CoA kinase